MSSRCSSDASAALGRHRSVLARKIPARAAPTAPRPSDHIPIPNCSPSSAEDNTAAQRRQHMRRIAGHRPKQYHDAKRNIFFFDTIVFFFFWCRLVGVYTFHSKVFYITLPSYTRSQTRPSSPFFCFISVSNLNYLIMGLNSLHAY